MPNYSEAEMRRLAAMLGNTRIAEGAMTNRDADKIMQNLGNTQTTNILPIPMNENNMPMFNTDAEYMQYLQEYDPAMFNEMQNTYYNTRGTMGEGKIEPMKFIKGLLGL
jgi:aldehyde:ferredoxin oxidoreductase